ncbi:uncharacterized protein LOC102394014 isoform X3 [Bubalus bubalis]|uniref:uncharacterized protein LOC102394014 isoform X3 n=1 Tax=Bubalus bubalis TaxID=89462 RepID=UPI001D0FDA5D|nr:uncharacterized protein LOC102394014 isoform X3 [Bubalus bubalis]
MEYRRSAKARRCAGGWAAGDVEKDRGGFQEAPEVEEEALQLLNPRLLPPQVLGVFLWCLHLPLQLFQPLLSEGRASLSPSGENSPEDQDTPALEEPAKPGPRPAVSRPTAHQYLSTETHQGDHTLHGSKHQPRDAGVSEPVSQERSHHQSLQRQPPTRPPRWKAEARRGQGSRVGPHWVAAPSSQLPWAEQRHRGHRQTRTQVSSWESSGLGFRPACGKVPE